MADAKRYPDLAERWANNETVASLAAHYGVSTASIYKAAREADLSPKWRRRPGLRPSRPLTGREEEIAARYAAGEKMRDIAASFGVTHQAVSFYLNTRAPGVLVAKQAERAARQQAAKDAKMSKRQGRVARREAAVRLYQQGVPVYQIAEITGYSLNYTQNLVYDRKAA